MPTTAIMLRVRVLTVCYLGNPELIIHNLEHGHCPTHTRLTTAHTAAEVTFLPAPATTPATTPQRGRIMDPDSRCHQYFADLSKFREGGFPPCCRSLRNY